MTALRRVYLDGTDLERDSEALMRFRLTYDGPLRSSQPGHITLTDKGERDKHAAHKHAIRRKLHPQIKHMWQAHRFLSAYSPRPNLFAEMLPAGALSRIPEHSNDPMPLAEMLGYAYGHNNYRFAPLIRQEILLTCSLRILCLRRDHEGAVLPARDIDNRIKTLIDALCRPKSEQGQPLGLDKLPLPPQEGEDPFYVLLDDDRQITHLEIETDALHTPIAAGEDESHAQLVITVETRAIQVTTWNQSLS